MQNGRISRYYTKLLQDTNDFLYYIAIQLNELGAIDINDHEVVKKLLRSLDNSFDTLIMMIKERPECKDLKPTNVLERLNSDEPQEEETRDLYGFNYCESHALKVVVDSSSKEQIDDYEFDNLIISFKISH